MTRRKWETNPFIGTCNICELELGAQPKVRRDGRWYHRACWQAEKGE